MDSDTKSAAAAEAGAVGPDTIETMMRLRIRDTIERLVEEELEVTLGATKSARVGAQRQGYRNGTRPRTLTTSVGPTTFTLPRARVDEADGTTREWQSTIVPRYQRRTARVDAALLGVYLTGTNTRRLKGASAPLLRGGPLGKDAVSRLVGRLQSDFEACRTRDLSTEDIAYLFLDGWYPVVRIGKQRARVAILVTLAGRTTGERVVLDLRLVGQETAAGWADAIAALVGRGFARPRVGRD
jgi:transposase-like protein